MMDRKTTPPTALKIPYKRNFFGDIRIDNYYWMENEKSPELIKYSQQENEYADNISEAASVHLY